MREIEFRVYCTRNNKMYSSEEIGDYSLEQLQRLSITDDEHTKFMQFTGLLDKNDTKIYEGDVLKHIYGIPYTSVNLEVWFTRATFRVKANDTKDKGLLLTELDRDSIEIIGNIYENPKLLEQS